MKKLLVKIGLWLAKLGGWREQYDFSQDEIDKALKIIMQVEEKYPSLSGSFKRAQAMRPLLNLGFNERRAGQIIEFLIDKYL